MPQGGVCPILYLTEIIRPNDPSMQRVCRAVEDARARTELLPTAWTLARVLTVDIIESVLEGVSGHCQVNEKSLLEVVYLMPADNSIGLKTR